MAQFRLIPRRLRRGASLVIEDDLENPWEENLRLRKVLSGIGLPVDIFAMTSERFSETKDVIGGLAYPANKYGKVIYEEP